MTNSIVSEIKSHSIKEIFDLCYPSHRLIQRGHRLWACCPVHAEKTPSFYLDVRKNMFSCHGCHIWGDAINLYGLAYGLNNREAITQLADYLGISRESSSESRKAYRTEQAKKHADAAMNQQISDMVKKARLECWDTERWLYMFKGTIHTELDFFRPGPVFALQNIARIEDIGDQFLDESPQVQLQAVITFRRWQSYQQQKTI